MPDHLELGNSHHKIPTHGAVIHNTQTGEHKQVLAAPVAAPVAPVAAVPQEEEEEEEEVDEMEVKMPYQFSLSLIKKLHEYLPEGHPLQSAIKDSIKHKKGNIIMKMNDTDYLINALKDNNENHKHQKEIDMLEARLKKHKK